MFHDKPTRIYILRDPRDNRVRYVGKTVQPSTRLSAHKRAPAGQHRCGRWLLELRGLELHPIMEIIETIPAGKPWAEREMFWIAHWRELEPDLTNTSNGGQDAPSMKQLPITIERRATTIRTRRASKGPLNHSPEARRERKRAAGHPAKFSSEWKAKIAASLKARYASLSPEEQEAIKERGRKSKGPVGAKRPDLQTPEYRAEQSLRLKQYLATLTPEERAARMKPAQDARRVP